jgi:hypothetical protein
MLMTSDLDAEGSEETAYNAAEESHTLIPSLQLLHFHGEALHGVKEYPVALLFRHVIPGVFCNDKSIPAIFHECTISFIPGFRIKPGMTVLYSWIPASVGVMEEEK